MTYGLTGLWSYLVPVLYFGINGLFALCVTALGLFVVARAWPLRDLWPLRLVGAGIALWGLSDLFGEFVWLGARLLGLSDVFYDALGSGLQRTGYAALHSVSALVTAASIGLIVVGLVEAVRRLALRHGSGG